MNPTDFIRSQVEDSGLPKVTIIPQDARRAAKTLRVRASRALLLPISALVPRAVSFDRDIEELFRNGDADQTQVAAAVVNDLALSIASKVPADEREAKLKVLYLCRHRFAFGDMQATWPAMFDAAIEHECARWGWPRPDHPSQRQPSAH